MASEQVPRARPRDDDLELSVEQMRRLLDGAAVRTIAHIESLSRQPSWATEGGDELARSLREPLPEEGRPAEELLDLVFEKVIPASLNTAAPGYLAYIPAGGLFQSAVADFVAQATNRYAGVFSVAPGLVALEANVLRWFCEIVGYPREAQGILTTGGSLSNFSALVTARRERLPENFLDGTIYTSDQTHHSVEKAAMLAGFPHGSVRVIPSDETFRIRVADVEAAIAEDRRAGKTPFLISANAGTTNTGAVDDLPRLADLAAREKLWLHVDGAYGGFFTLTAEGKKTLTGIERADSIVLDPHKSLFLPYGTGCLLVRDGPALKRAHALTAVYLPSMQEDPEQPDFNLLSPELSREWRGLRVWLPIKMHGIGAFRRALEEKLALARAAADALRAMPGIEIVAEPQLSLVAFRAVRRGEDDEAANAANKALLDRINARKRVYLTGTRLGSRFVLRLCVLSFRTHAEAIRMALEDIRASLEEAR
ncbi:MAG TPA: aminotransferase class I/II-fold pyridoxal phosphate-dependent enzyme [Thermoanaerobaculia bacterium]